MSRRYLAVFVLLALGCVLLVSSAVGATLPPADGNNGWYTSSFTITFVADDGSDCGQKAHPGEGLADGQGITRASDLCSDGSTDTTVPFDYDDENPSVSIASRLPGPNANGWNNTPVTVSFNCDDNASGIAGGCPGPQTFGQGANQTASSGAVSDVAGNGPVSASVPNINVDTTAPTIGAGTGAPAANGTGWRNSAVTVTFPCTDGLSGPASANVSVQVTTQGQNQTSPAATCSDLAGNTSGPNTLGGISIDTTAPVLTVPTVAPIEATGPTGAVANIVPAPSATDNLATGTGPGPVPVMCNRSLTTAFPLGTTAVNCTAADGHGLSTPRSFNVIVRDTTPPTLPDNIPNRIEIYENASGGASRNHPTIAELLAVKATDIVDTDVTMTNNAPAVFALEENTLLTITATDDSANVATRQVTIFVRRIPPGANPNAAQFRPPSLDLAAPRNPTQLRVQTGDHKVTLTWQRSTSADLKEYVVTREVLPKTTTRTPQRAAAAPIVVYRGPNTTYTDKKLKNGIQYRYVVASEDRAGNRSAGVAIVAVAKPILLVAPKEGAQLKSPITFRWAPVPKAAYYNLQLFRLQGKKEIKVLSTWPSKATFTLRKTWTFNGRSYKLLRDQYRWYVFPGFGKRSEVRYGAALGASEFRVGNKAPAKKPPATTAGTATSRYKP